jgi:hypothetical protein
MIASVTTSQSNKEKKKHWGKYVEPFHDAKK